jgi:hypothetical protein
MAVGIGASFIVNLMVCLYVVRVLVLVIEVDRSRIQIRMYNSALKIVSGKHLSNRDWQEGPAEL